MTKNLIQQVTMSYLEQLNKLIKQFKIELTIIKYKKNKKNNVWKFITTCKKSILIRAAPHLFLTSYVDVLRL